MTATYNAWFQVADADSDGRVTGGDAVQFFTRSGLPRETLAKVWELANSARKGFLDRQSFFMAMELISIAQQGIDVNKDNYLKAKEGKISLPKMQGLDENGVIPPVSSLEKESPRPSGQGYSHVASAAANQAPPLSQYQPAAPSTAQYSLGYNPGGSSAPTPESEPSRMFSQPLESGGRAWGSRKSREAKPVPGKVCTSVIDGLKNIYFNKVRPLEEQFKFGAFFSPLLHPSDFEAKPTVMLLGQYSTGKTTFIKYLLGRDYPGCHIGPEPTTDRFVVVMHGLEERRIPGNTLAVQPDKPYQGLSMFGTGFLSRFEGSQCPARLLEEISIIDTPGVLAGEKQRIERNYNFTDVCAWFAGRSDLILLLFDPYKLDISDEFKSVISCLKGHDDKVRVVLNKADQVDQQQLMRVYGALMWSLSKVFRSPEVCKVYIGSFNSEAPIQTNKNPYAKELFEVEQSGLLADLYEIPQRSADRKINEFVKRVRAIKIHMLLLGHMRGKMPMFGKEKAQKKMLEELPDHFHQVQREHHLPPGDFPDVGRFREILSAFDINTFPKVSEKMIKQIDDVLGVDIPNLVKQFDNPF